MSRRPERFIMAMNIPRKSMPPKDGLPKPTRLSEWPGYIMKLIKGFFARLFYIVSLVWRSAPMMLFCMAILCAADGFLPVVGAYISRELLNAIAELITDRDILGLSSDAFKTLSPIFFILLLNFIYLFLRKLLTRINNMVTQISGELVVNYIKVMMLEKAKTVDIASYDRPEFYEKLENANREASMRPIHILTATFNVISALISAISFVIVLIGVSPFAPLIILLASLPGAIVNYYFRHRSFRYMRWHSKERREMMYYSGLMVDKDRAKEIRILGLSDTFIDRYKGVFSKYYKGLRSLILKEGISQMIVGLISTLINCGLLVMVAYSVIYENGLIGDFSLYSGALSSIGTYVTTLLSSTATIYEGTLFIENMMDFMKEERHISAPPEPIEPKRGEDHTIVFENVSFMYPAADRYVLKDVSFEINSRDSVVLVGLNGAGKTTLIKLLTRLYDPTEGRILLDGHDLREYEPEKLYNIFGIIFQDYGKYAETAGENIRLGDCAREYNAEEIKSAAVAGNAHDFIMSLRNGYETPLTRMFEDDGIELSGGQWQKICISRAFFKESDILILDEPTASLDPIAEAEVFRQFSELSENKITIFVSHRLSSAVGATKIVVLDGGRVAEIGKHEELMALGGRYHHLFTVQAERYTAACGESDEDELHTHPVRPHRKERFTDDVSSEF